MHNPGEAPGGAATRGRHNWICARRAHIGQDVASHAWKEELLHIVSMADRLRYRAPMSLICGEEYVCDRARVLEPRDVRGLRRHGGCRRALQRPRRCQTMLHRSKGFWRNLTAALRITRFTNFPAGGRARGGPAMPGKDADELTSPRYSMEIASGCSNAVTPGTRTVGAYLFTERGLKRVLVA